jgi:DNA invertase Pin-like site-specific DNA recombinase
MIAAIYARESNDQNGIADEAKSVTRQIEHATAYAQLKGWTLDERFVFVDDGISGAEFANRPGFVRLMNALKPKPTFGALIMSEESRLGREMIETSYALKQIVTAGVRVFYYLEDRERTLDSPTDKVLLAVNAYAGELEREMARQRSRDAARQRATHGYVTGGTCFGYRNVRTDSGRVVREIDPKESAVVVRIFELCRDGKGPRRIAQTLNAEHAPAPRAQQRRPHGWVPSSVRAVLHRDVYRGQVIWGKARKRNTWG